MTEVYYKIIHGDGLSAVQDLHAVDVIHCIFADPPDNIGLKYGGYVDKMPEHEYRIFLHNILMLTNYAHTLWLSYNPKHVFTIGSLLCDDANRYAQYISKGSNSYSVLEARQMVQTFTFGQHRQTDFGTNHRPLLRLRWQDAPIYTHNIRTPSWRQLNGDRRADSRGRVPGDVFDFPRVTGNSKQRRKWSPTQLHEGLVERCILSCTQPGDVVFDPFAGTGTTLRVCKKHQRSCVTADVDRTNCEHIAREHNLEVMRYE